MIFTEEFTECSTETCKHRTEQTPNSDNNDSQ